MTCLYLYADGHAVAVFEKRDKQTGVNIEYIEVFEKLVHPTAPLLFKGRIVFHRYHAAGMFQLLKGAKYVRAHLPVLSEGSDATKRLNLKVGGLEIQLAKGGTIIFSTVPEVLSSGFTYDEDQLGYVEKFDASAREWCGKPIIKIHRVTENKSE